MPSPPMVSLTMSASRVAAASRTAVKRAAAAS
jgi:hypothetical protein